MDLRVYLPTFNIEQHENTLLEQFLLLLDESSDRQNAFFDESITGYVVLSNRDPLNPKETEVYMDTLRKAFLSIDLSVHPAKNNVARQKPQPEADKFLIRTFNYSFKDCIFNELYSPAAVSEEANANSDSDEDYEPRFISIWKFLLPVFYPKRKINNPEIIISILLTLENYQTMIQRMKLAEKYTSGGSVSSHPLTIHENASLDELTLKLVYRPIEEPNLLQGILAHVKSSGLLIESLPVLPLLQVQEDSTLSLGLLSAEAIEQNQDRRALMILNFLVVESLPKTINLNARILLPVYPVLNMRLKCTKPAGRNDILLTTLEIESSKELNKINMLLDLLEINIEFPNGSIKPVIPKHLQKFPIKINYNDNVNFVYELLNNNSSENLAKKPIMIQLISQPIPKDEHDQLHSAFIKDASDGFTSSKIVTKWNTLVDFSIIAPPTNTALKSLGLGASSGNRQTKVKTGMASALASPQLSSKEHKFDNSVASLSMGVFSENQDTVLETHQELKSQTRAASTSLTVNIPRTSKSLVLNGLMLSFNGTTNVKIGQIFKWRIQAINKSHRILNLSLYIQPKDNNNHLFLTTNMSEKVKSAQGSFNNSYNRVSLNPIIYPLSNSPESGGVNLTKVFNQTKLTPSGIICLNNDVRIGPFDHHSVFETEINLIAIEKGIFSLQGVKIIDIPSGESFDCGKLLEVVVFD